jgi:hypothetical protein
VTELADLVRRAHEGEVLGEALFTALAAEADGPDHRSKLEACARLEAQTRARVAGLAADLGVDLDDAEAAAQAGRSAAANLTAMSWPDLMGAIAGGTAGYRALYAELLDVAPDPTHPVLPALVRHELAPNAFTAAEAAGEPDALDHLLAVLD